MKVKITALQTLEEQLYVVLHAERNAATDTLTPPPSPILSMNCIESLKISLFSNFELNQFRAALTF